MSDCGGDCGGCGDGCGGDCGQPTKYITIEKQGVTSGISYKGDAISCASDSSIDIADGESLNSVIQKVLSSLCGLSTKGNVTPFTDVNVVHSGAPRTEVMTTFAFPVSEVKAGEGIRVRFSGFYQTSPTGQITLTPKKYTVDSSGTPSGLSPINLTIIPSSVGEDIVYEFTIMRSLTDPTKIFIDLYIRSYVSSVPGSVSVTQYGGGSTVADLDVNGIGFEFEVVSTNALDQFTLAQTSIEHLRP